MIVVVYGIMAVLVIYVLVGRVGQRCCDHSAGRCFQGKACPDVIKS